MMGLIQGWYHEMMFRAYSAPVSAKLGTMGFGLMLAAVLVSINIYDFQSMPTNPQDINNLAYLGLVALIGMILFGSGIGYGIRDLYLHFFRREATK